MNKICYKIKSCSTPCLGSVLHVHAQWVTPSPVPGVAIGQSLELALILNIRKLFTKQALKRSEQNFVTKLNHVPHLAWGLHCMSMPNGLLKARSQGGVICQSLKGSVLSNIRKFFTNQALERSEQNFVTKLNHVPHLAWGLYCMSMPSGLPPAWSHGVLEVKV